MQYQVGEGWRKWVWISSPHHLGVSIADTLSHRHIHLVLQATIAYDPQDTKEVRPAPTMEKACPSFLHAHPIRFSSDTPISYKSAPRRCPLLPVTYPSLPRHVIVSNQAFYRNKIWIASGCVKEALWGENGPQKMMTMPGFWVVLWRPRRRNLTQQKRGRLGRPLDEILTISGSKPETMLGGNNSSQELWEAHTG